MLKKLILLAGKTRKLILLVFDILLFIGVTFLFFIATKRFLIPFSWTQVHFLLNAVILACCMVLFRLIFHVYSSVWRYTNTLSYLKLFVADTLAALVCLGLSFIFRIHPGMLFFSFISPITLLATLLSRFLYRFWYKKSRRSADFTEAERIPVAIVGAGFLGSLLADELKYRNSVYDPIFFIDKKITKVGSKIAGLKVYHNDEEEIPALLSKHGIREVFVAITKIDSESAKKIFEFYSRFSCKVKIYDIPVTDFGKSEADGRSARTIREFQIEDLLFREAININSEKTKNYYSGKTVMVTGGGGSIGSEICRQLAKCSPKRLIILDIYENNAYDIQQELVREYGNKLDLVVEIASVRDRLRLDDIFKFYRPDIVFHAAAHKHVPLMERSATEAIKNNVLGTYNTADMAEKYGVEKFIMISTDKAVNPTNVMGASKRMCEMVIQCRTDSKTSFAAVRFGNVLGSNGSVIPLFKKQIAMGGPVTITDKRIIRYFMTIPEASQLVMEAGAMAKKGELFVLDMGKPVRIYDLARNMIKLSGFEPEVDIEIKEIGLRPGEKLYEELLMKTEELDKTDNKMIFIEKDTPLSRKEVEDKLDILREAVQSSNAENANELVKLAIKQVVPTFHEPEELNKRAAETEEVKMAAAVK